MSTAQQRRSPAPQCTIQLHMQNKDESKPGVAKAFIYSSLSDLNSRRKNYTDQKNMWLFFPAAKDCFLSQSEPGHLSVLGLPLIKLSEVYIGEHWLRCLPRQEKNTKSILSRLITIRHKHPKICANQSAFGSRAKGWQSLDLGEEQSRLVKTSKHLLEDTRSPWISINVRMSKKRKPGGKRKGKV